ncbi:histidinol-phosphate transaminase [Streptomyces sp. R302]|uniref:histidinol-phosphate transaminase n=1 Tax=unclassified Streptomyces TaxID=2593676 RepID=UPI00145C3B3A|nr:MULTISPECIES: histidinol-phosphate transaminase [unclassified Streptomyces]NML51334.1 histidinol-phosphate transaminase [Streptomyces sp. R301]NML79912.1 histidinol-phosphate transaminase [Streptomyces sp. R302]
MPPTPAPRLRADVSELPPYVPGRAAPDDRVDKLSSNENPYPPLPSVVDVMREELGRVNRYPDPANRALVTKLSEVLAVPPEHLVPGTGSLGVTRDLLRAAAGEGDEVLFAWRSFEAYPQLTWANGATAVRIPLRDGRHDLDAMADAVTSRTRVVIVCNPNNPTGTAVRRGELERFLDRVPGHVLVVLDEAYREFVDDPDVPDGIELYRERPNVAVLRTFSKAYGLAQLRVGYAIAHPPVAAALRACAVPFGVSGLAGAAARASLDAGPELLERIRTLVAERARVTRTLRSAGWQVPESQANFVWLPIGSRTRAFTDSCEAAGVMVRPFGDEGVRVTIGTPEANDRLLKIAAAWHV